MTGGKGSCSKEGVTYSISCNNCAKGDIVRVYHGETSMAYDKFHNNYFKEKKLKSLKF